MLKVAIAGASGYTGVELIRLLLKHPEVKIHAMTSETWQGKPVTDVFPSLAGHIEDEFVPFDSSLLGDCDVVFLALPHTTAMEKVPVFLKNDQQVIDLSADFRLNSAEIFEQWYKVPHSQPGLLSEAVYGLPEINREKIKSAKLVANPGCYPTSVLLAIAPLAKEDWANLDSIIADSKSGVSGAGRKASLGTHFGECNEAVSAYGLGTHRHTPEIEQHFSSLAGREIQVTFSPHLMPMTRGLLSTVYVDLKKSMDADELANHYRDYYRQEPFVRVLKTGTFANTHHVKHSNYCDIGVQVDSRTGRAIITSAIDNLIKGASGQAVQNMNLLRGFDETLGLDAPGLYP
jgi:N-acetyl-gamma-glutamyl-phosphate reductase